MVVAAALGAVVLAVAGPAQATITEALSLTELIQRADHVVVVSCVGREVRRDHARRIVTDHSLIVEEVLRGAAAVGDHLSMRSLGGAIGDIGMRVEGEPHLRLGQRYVVFLRRIDTGRPLRPVGMSQGVLPVEDRAGVLTVLPGGEGLALRQRVHDGQLAPAPAALLHPESLDALRERMGSLAP